MGGGLVIPLKSLVSEISADLWQQSNDWSRYKDGTHVEVGKPVGERHGVGGGRRLALAARKPGFLRLARQKTGLAWLEGETDLNPLVLGGNGQWIRHLWGLPAPSGSVRVHPMRFGMRGLAGKRGLVRQMAAGTRPRRRLDRNPACPQPVGSARPLFSLSNKRIHPFLPRVLSLRAAL